MTELIAVIPARGESKRIPRKNIVDFEGRPLIVWTIEAAQASGCFERIIVSTDDREIADVSAACGAEVPGLRSSHTDDHAPVSLVTIDVLSGLQSKQPVARNVVQLFAACPLRTGEDIRDAVTGFEQGRADFQLSCYRWRGGHPYWSFTIDTHKGPRPLFPEKRFMRSQDLPPVFIPSGAVWIARSAALLESGTFYGPGHVFRELPWERAVDIDTYEDLELARLLHRAANRT